MEIIKMTMKTHQITMIALLVVLSLQSQMDGIDDNYDNYKKQQGKKYSTSQEATYRNQVYNSNVDKMRKHNAKSDSTYKQGTNQFSDMTPDEFKQKTLMPGNSWVDSEVKAAIAAASSTPVVAAGTTVVALAASVDWTSKMNPIKNQGQCGSCWAFTAVGTLEAGIRIKNGSAYTFSEQELVDCCMRNLTICSVSSGCNGGSTIQAYNYVASYGIATSSYIYTGIQSTTCKRASYARNKMLKTTGTYTAIIPNNANYLKGNVTARPVAVYVDASSWMTYASGIFNKCTYTGINHAVILVGYDVNSNWKVRNHWSTTWGEAGYIRIAPDNTVGGACGILSSPFIPNFL